MVYSVEEIVTAPSQFNYILTQAEQNIKNGNILQAIHYCNMVLM